MQFIYDKNAGEKTLILDAKQNHYLFNVRRFKAQDGEIFKFANLNDGKIYKYQFAESRGKGAESSPDSATRTKSAESRAKSATFHLLDSATQNDLSLRVNPKDLRGKPPCKNYTKGAESRAKSATFHLLDSANIAQESPQTHIIQAVIDDFDKILPFLNELFVEKITLFYADFSQKNIRVNLERMEAILISSSMQCGRLSKMEIEILASLDEVLANYSDASCEIVALDFAPKAQNLGDFKRFIIGCEGGFSPRERELLKERKIATSGINHPLILRAKTASIFIASRRI